MFLYEGTPKLENVQRPRDSEEVASISTFWLGVLSKLGLRIASQVYRVVAENPTGDIWATHAQCRKFGVFVFLGIAD